MQYLPRPKDAALPPIEVVFHEPHKYWHDGSWEEHASDTYWDSFPRRYGYEQDDFWAQEGHTNKAWSHSEFHLFLMSKSRPELEGMVIGWLYFGTLAEVTRCSLDIDNYLTLNKDGHRVLDMTSERMDVLLNRWRIIASHFKGSVHVRGAPDTSPFQIFEADRGAVEIDKDGLKRQLSTFLSEQYIRSLRARLDGKGKSKQFERAHKCLQRSKAILGLVAEVVDHEIVYVVASLHEFLAAALTHIFEGEVLDAYDLAGKYSLGLWVEGLDFTGYSRSAVETLGWCPRTVSHFMKSMDRTLTLDNFLINLKMHETSENHSSCSENICVAYQLNPDDYIVKHIPDNPLCCNGSQLELDTDVSAAVLSAGPDSYPLINVVPSENSDTAFIEAMDAADQEEYVAISHVWSHGLGNPRANSLPTCQLKRIQCFVDSLASQSGMNQHPMPFWMDTLCCPRMPQEARRDAIMKMAMTYKRASHVLVLDQNLAQISTENLSSLEVLMQIYRTAWMKRLWTLQEARLAKQLWFQFKDRAVNLKDAQDRFLQFRGSATALVVAEQIRDAVEVKWSGLRGQWHQDTNISYSGVDGSSMTGSLRRLIALTYSVGDRSTSWATDEAICLCNILGFDLGPILDISVDEPSSAALRMKAMWKQWTELPAAIIFNRASRITCGGYRWAPSTYVRSNGAMPFVEIDNTAKIDPDGQGLVATLPLYVLRNNTPLIMVEKDIKLELETDARRERASGTDGLRRYATFLIYDPFSTTLPKWYDVRIEKPVHEEMPDFDRAAELALVTSQDKNMSNVDHRSMPGLLSVIRKTDLTKPIIYTTSLYHVGISRARPELEKLFTGALAIRNILKENESLCGQYEDGRVRPGSEFDPSDASTQRAMGSIRAIAQTTLDDPAIKAYLEQIRVLNHRPEDAEWANASQEQRDDWNFRVDHGDAKTFFNDIVNVWLNLSSAAVPMVATVCVD